METSLTTAQSWEDPKLLNKRINRMIDIQKSVMKREVDYGSIPGCDKPTLLKPGAELLCCTFKVGDRMAPGYPMKDVDPITGHITVDIVLEFYDQGTGVTIGQGAGSCSTAEEKYAWRRAVCDEEFEITDDEQKRIKFAKGRGQVYKNMQIRTNPKDLENTVLKMAKKRAKVDGTLNVLAASRVFAQDLEELPEGMDASQMERSSKPNMAPPTEAGPPPSNPDRSKCISEKQEKRLYAIAKKHEVKIEHIKSWLGQNGALRSPHLSDITSGAEYDRICKTCENKPTFFSEFAQKQAQNPSKGAPATNEAPEPQNEGTGPVSGGQERRSALASNVEAMRQHLDWTPEEVSAWLKKNFKVESVESVPSEQEADVLSKLNLELDKLAEKDA